MALTVCSTFGSLHCRHIRNIAVVTNNVVVDEITDFLYQTVVTHRHVTQCGVVDARMLRKALGHFDHLFEFTQANIAIEYHTVEIIGAEVLGHLYSVPVLGPTAIAFKHLNFLLCQLSVISHKCIFFGSKILLLLFLLLLSLLLNYFVKEIIIRILLHMKLAHLLIQHLAQLVDVLLLLRADEQRFNNIKHSNSPDTVRCLRKAQAQKIFPVLYHYTARGFFCCKINTSAAL